MDRRNLIHAFLARLTCFVLLGLFLAGLEPAAAYGVLTHNQLVDQAWASGIVPLLLSRYPSLTAEQLREAHAFAYGGCLIQDFGYYPFADSFIAGLMHYVRSGDFVESLFHNAQNANELAFAIGALSHFIGDSIGYSAATNPSVALVFPKLKARYGPSVNYAQDKRAHGQVELAFDANQFARGRLAPSKYLHEVGLAIPRRQLAAAFCETYGLTAKEAIGGYEPALRIYRFGARVFLPTFVCTAIVFRPTPPIPNSTSTTGMARDLPAKLGGSNTLESLVWVRMPWPASLPFCRRLALSRCWISKALLLKLNGCTSEA